MRVSGQCEGGAMNKKAQDIKNPIHYSGNGIIECKDALRSMLHNAMNSNAKLTPTTIYWWGCAFKYLWRWPWKNRKKDIDKCIQCLKFLKKELD